MWHQRCVLRRNVYPAVCGNERVERAEQCDDGNLVNHDGCTANCTAEQAAWMELSPTTWPSNRSHGALAYDALRGRLVLFGGYNEVGTRLGDTWEFDGTEWLPTIPMAPLPVPRSDFALVFDAKRGRTVL